MASRSIAILVAIAILFPLTAMATNHQVSIVDFAFSPNNLTVDQGDTVTWTNKGRFPHTTTSGVNGKPDGLWDTKHLARGESFSYVFSQPGTYHYFCRPHHGLGMKGVVVVTHR